MTVQSKSWEQVGEKFDLIGTHLRSRLDEVGADAAADRAAFEKALQAMLSAIEETFGAAGTFVRDPTLRKDFSELARSVREALLATVEKAGEGIREQLSVSAIGSRSATDGKRSPARKKTAGKPVGGKPVARKAVARKPVARKAVARKRASD